MVEQTASTPTLPPQPTHADRFRDVLSRLRYKDWTFRLGIEPRGYWLRVEFQAPDTDAAGQGEAEIQRGRKWLLSEHMTESEIVQTAFKAVLAAEEHEAREQFTVEGVAVLGPHLDLFGLIALHKVGMLPIAKRE